MKHEPDKQAWLSQWEHTFGRHAWDDDLVLELTSNKNGWKGSYADVNDPDEAWAIASRWGHEDVYLGMGIIRREIAYRDSGRCKKPDVAYLGHLWLDVDVSAGVHSEPDLPTYKQAGELCRGLITHTVAIDSGGGMHLYYSLGQPLPYADEAGRINEETNETLKRWADRWLGRFGSGGFKVDAKVSRTPTSLLRMAGTTSTWKYAEHGLPSRPVRIREVNSEAVYTRGEIEELCPPRPKVQVITNSGHIIERDLDPTRTARVLGKGTVSKVNRAVPTESILEAVWRMRDEGDRWTYPQEDGTYLDATNAQVFTHSDGVRAVTAFSARLQRAWGLPDEQHSLRPWDLLVIALGGNPGLAKAIADQTLPDVDALLAQMRRAVDHRSNKAASA